MLVDFYNNPKQSELRLVTAREDFRDENVRGISCRGLINVYRNLFTNSSSPVSNDQVSVNATVQLYIIANALKSLEDTVKNVNLKRIVDLLNEHDRRESAENKNLEKIVDFIEIQNNVSTDVAHANHLSLNAFKQSSENITSQLKEIALVVNRSLSNINVKPERAFDPNTTEKKPNNPTIIDTDLKKIIVNYMEEEKVNLIRELESKISNLRPANDDKTSEKWLKNVKDNNSNATSQLFSHWYLIQKPDQMLSRNLDHRND
ncbi:hypothetical protein EVAR_47986_1 [Eumeta japonica]|uniref:Uncharacterized protein n=1 Tax=Eumeta variegata TaxID=151549 RepID=A0A4C1XJP5_EUMVA|nr:hypothetical protein EVAR_47986_1 [Eumeta japonica]